MGTWGSGPFDNDDAADWAWSLTDSADDAVLRAALLAPLAAAKTEAPEGQVAIAAAEVVAAGLGRPSPALPEEVAAWVAAHPLPWAELAGPARQAISRLRASSELRDLWAESGEGAAWAANVEHLERRLR
jgi:Domain of unknown function (DUF4259)